MKSPIIIANNFWHFDQAGGSYKISTDLAIHLAANGHNVHYICMGPPNTRLGLSTEHDVKIWRYPEAGGRGAGKSPSRYFHHLRRAGDIARQIYRSSAPDGPVILNGHSSLQYLGAMRGLPRGKVFRAIASVHSPLEHEYRAEKASDAWTIKDFLASKLLSWTENRCYFHSDVIQCDSRFTRSLLDASYPRSVAGKTLVCPGYVDTAVFVPSDKPKAELRHGMKNAAWRTNDVVFFCLRRHVKRMGIDALIRAAAWVRDNNRSGKNFRVIIGGDGPLRGGLEALAADLKLTDAVSFAGKIPEADLASHYQAADCFVLPTRSLECFGLIILESFACGTPVIATPVGSIPEVLGDFAAESLAAGLRPEEIGASMIDFLNKPRNKSRADLRQYAETFDKSKILARLEKIVTGSDAHR